MNSRSLVVALLVGAGITGGLLFDYVRTPSLVATTETPEGEPLKKEKTVEERIAEARKKSQNRKGLYMTYDVAADQGVAAKRLRNAIIKILDETEINAVVIDTKENQGTMISENLKETVGTLHEHNAWVIARMTMFRDNSQMKKHPEFYAKRLDGSFWLDNHKNGWLDASDPLAWEYERDEVKKVIDCGFDEVQFDYVRFPSDGNMSAIHYPSYDVKRPKYEVIKGFLSYMKKELKVYKPEIILSADLFGYVAVQTEDLSIGQRLIDVADSVDYISLMVYPSHYYSGFYVPNDAERNLPSIFIPYKDPDATKVVSSQPHPIIYRSLLAAEDMLTKKIIATSTAPDGTVATTTTKIAPTVKMRPWLQDFDLGVDKARGIYYDAAKVRAEIDAADAAGASGWLLWNPSNVYTVEALHAE